MMNLFLLLGGWVWMKTMEEDDGLFCIVHQWHVYEGSVMDCESVLKLWV